MKRLAVLIIIIFVALFSCEKNEILSPEKQEFQVSLDIQGLNNLGDNFWYEAWIGTDGSFTSVGVFTVDDNNALSKTDFDTELGNLQSGKWILISIEEDDVPGMRFRTTFDGDSAIIDTFLTPTSYRILASKIVANNGQVSIGDENLLDFDFSQTAGTYTVDTPTDTLGSDTRGVWFMNVDTSGANIAGLNLPVLSGGWKYEGMLNVNGELFSMGKFTSPGGADDNAIYSEPSGTGYPFPGEDFIFPDTTGRQLPADLSGHEIFINLLPPHPAGSNTPFALVPLKATIPAGATAKTYYEMTKNTDELPGGDMAVNVKIYE